MKSFVLLLGIVGTLCHGASITKVVGGHNANIEDHPYTASLEYKEQFFCGAAIISENYVLTAASCVYK